MEALSSGLFLSPLPVDSDAYEMVLAEQSHVEPDLT